MPTSQIMVKRLGAFRPLDNNDECAEAMRKIPENDLVRVTWTRPQNIKLRRKFFAMLQIIFKNQSHYKSVEELKEVCKIRIGHVYVVQTPQGEERWPKRMNYSSMDAQEFDIFYNKAVDWMLSEVIPGLQRQHLDKEVEDELIGFAA